MAGVPVVQRPGSPAQAGSIGSRALIGLFGGAEEGDRARTSCPEKRTPRPSHSAGAFVFLPPVRSVNGQSSTGSQAAHWCCFSMGWISEPGESRPLHKHRLQAAAPDSQLGSGRLNKVPTTEFSLVCQARWRNSAHRRVDGNRGGSSGAGSSRRGSGHGEPSPTIAA